MTCETIMSVKAVEIATEYTFAFVAFTLGMLWYECIIDVFIPMERLLVVCAVMSFFTYTLVRNWLLSTPDPIMCVFAIVSFVTWCLFHVTLTKNPDILGLCAPPIYIFAAYCAITLFLKIMLCRNRLLKITNKQIHHL